VRKLSVGQRKALSEFFTNGAVAWLSTGVIAPFFATKRLQDFAISGLIGAVWTIGFLTISLLFTKGVKT